jgi:transcriptional pleiotropic regulator of transition state genes
MRRGIPEVILGSPYNALASGFRCQGLGKRNPMAANGNKRDAGRTGIVRHIDELGRIVIPSEIRKRFGFGVKDPVEISVRGETILLSRPQTICVFCGRSEGLSEYRGRCVCHTCIAELKSVAA